MSSLNTLEKKYLKTDIPLLQAGDIVKVYQKNLDKEGGKPQIFEGLILAKKHGQGLKATITVRKEIKGIGVERIFPLHSPLVEKIEVVKKGKIRRAKLYYLRGAQGKKKRIKARQEKPVSTTAEKEIEIETPEKE
jgi:large subunit ribosomal protein L19